MHEHTTSQESKPDGSDQPKPNLALRVGRMFHLSNQSSSVEISADFNPNETHVAEESTDGTDDNDEEESFKELLRVVSEPSAIPQPSRTVMKPPQDQPQTQSVSTSVPKTSFADRSSASSLLNIRKEVFEDHPLSSGGTSGHSKQSSQFPVVSQRQTSRRPLRFGRNRDRIQQELEDALEYANSVISQQDEREKWFKKYIKDLVEERDSLVMQCNSLSKSRSQRRTAVNEVDDETLRDKFLSLEYDVRTWCLELWDLKRPNTMFIFTSSPLSTFHLEKSLCLRDSPWILVACLWEWLIKLVFGGGSAEERRTFDLWTDLKTAESIQWLEGRVSEVQTRKPEVQHEWRSFTIQCLSDTGGTISIPEDRLESTVTRIMTFYLTLFGFSQSNSVAKELKQKLVDSVVREAATLAHMMRFRLHPPAISLPHNVTEQVQAWEKGSSTGDVEIYVCPQLASQDTILVEAKMEKLNALS